MCRPAQTPSGANSKAHAGCFQISLQHVLLRILRLTGCPFSCSAFSSQKKGTPQPQQGQLHLAAQQPGLNRAALHSTQTAPLNSTHAATLHAGQPDQKLGVLATPQVMSTMPLTSRAHPSMAPAIDPSDAQHHDPRKNRLAKLGSGSPPMKILSHAEFNPGNARPLKNPSKPTALHTTTVQSAPQLSHPPCAYSQIASPQEQALPGSKASYAPHLQRFGQPTAENPLPTPSTTPHQKAAYPQPRLQHNLIPQPVLKSGHVTSSEIQPTQRSQPNHSHTLLEPGDPRTLGYGTDQVPYLEHAKFTLRIAEPVSYPMLVGPMA